VTITSSAGEATLADSRSARSPRVWAAVHIPRGRPAADANVSFRHRLTSRPAPKVISVISYQRDRGRDCPVAEISAMKRTIRTLGWRFNAIAW